MMMAVFPWAMAVTVIMVVPMVVCVPMLMTVPMIVGVAIMVMIAMAIGMIVVVRVAVGPDAFDVMVVALLGKPTSASNPRTCARYLHSAQFILFSPSMISWTRSAKASSTRG